MPSPAGWREVPCVECGAYVRGIDFGDRCQDCLGRRQLRAVRLARPLALFATAAVGVWVISRAPASTPGRWSAAVGVGATYALVRAIAFRIAMEVLP